jgi:hypothetical protein
MARLAPRRHRGQEGHLVEIDRSGDPDEFIGITDFARVLGYSGTDPGAALRSYLRRNPDYLSAPDRVDRLPSGRVRRRWRRRAVWAFA